MMVHLSSDPQTPFLRSSAMLLISWAFIVGTVIEALQVIGGDRSVVEKGTVVLPCKFIDNKETLTQISWQRKTRGKPKNDNFFTISDTNEAKYFNGEEKRFEFIGDVNDGNGSLQLSDVKLEDEGTYACVVTLFPSGNHQASITLNVLVPPVSSLKDNLPVLGCGEVSLVTCTAAGSKPPAEVEWITGTLPGLKATTTNSTHDNDTTTTYSSLIGVPTKEIYHQEVKCVVTSEALSGNQILAYSIEIYFPPGPPMVNTTEGKDSKSFSCSAEANPEAEFTWSRHNKPWPDSFVRNGATLSFKSITTDDEGLYHCTASNTYGSTNGSLLVGVEQGKSSPAGWVLFALLLALNVAAVAVWYLKFRRTQESEHVAVPVNSRNLSGTESEGEDAEGPI